jgi:cytochrome b6-f complex iron-sulfur subunit
VSVLAIQNGTVAVIVAVILADLFLIYFVTGAARRNAAAKRAASGEVPATTTKGTISRRDFQRRALLSSVLLFGAEFGLGTIGFLWPNLKGGFGAKINAGPLNDIKSQAETDSYVYVGQGRFYIVPWSGTAGTGQADYPGEGVTAEGIMPLYQRCVHLGCRVPFCASSQWFECPCHGSKYNNVGEYKLGPAPRGLDRFPIEIDSANNVIVDTSTIKLGPPRGTNTTDQPQEGPFCVATG